MILVKGKSFSLLLAMGLFGILAKSQASTPDIYADNITMVRASADVPTAFESSAKDDAKDTTLLNNSPSAAIESTGEADLNTKKVSTNTRTRKKKKSQN